MSQAPDQGRQLPGSHPASDSSPDHTRLVAVAWAAFQPRTVTLAKELQGDAVFVHSRGLGARILLTPFRYVARAVSTWRLLQRRYPERVLVITPPVFAPLICWLWCAVRHRAFVVDCHTGAFHSPKWAWARPIHRWLLRRASAVLVHTDEALALVKGWGAVGLLMPDDVPEAGDALPREQPERPTVLVAGSFDDNEPVAEVIEAARLLPEMELRLTGDPDRVPPALRRSAPANAIFTGFLPYRVFLGEMAAAHVVAAFSTDPQIMNRAAFEALGLGRPLVLTDLAGLRSRFGEAAAFSPNQPPAMAEALRGAFRDQQVLARRSEALAVALRTQRERALAELRSLLHRAQGAGADAAWRRDRSDHRAGAVLIVTQHSFAEENILRRNVFELLDRGFDVDVVCSAGIDGAPPTDRRPGLRIHRVPIRHRRRPVIRYPLEYAAFFLAALAQVSRLALRRRYRAVQVDNLPDFLVFVTLVPRLRGARVVFNMFELTPEMVSDRFATWPGPVLLWLARRMEAAATWWADQVIVVSEQCRRMVVERGVPESKLAVVLNMTTAVAGDADAPALSGKRAGRPFIVTHTTLLERYGVQVAIRGLAHLAAMWPDLQLRVIGEGEQRPELERLAAELGLAERVVFTGFLPWPETMAQVRQAAVGIVAVTAGGYGELLLPTKLLEYARFGVPAVCSRLPVIEHYFPDDSLAYFTPEDPEGLAAQVDRLLRDPDAAARQRLRAQEVARSLAWDQVRGEYLKALGLAEPAAQPAPVKTDLGQESS